MLHATQRMQAVNFFLVAIAFLGAAYVSALCFPTVAVVVSMLGVVFSIVFCLLEVRIRELLKAGEKALSHAQKQLADLTGVPEFKICDAVEKPKTPYTTYNIIIKTLCLSTAFSFVLGFVYAIHLLR